MTLTSTTDERTRLIEEEEDDQVNLGTSSSISTPTPLPWRPLLVVLVLNAMQPLAFEIVFPFVNQMILEIGVVNDPERVGFYSGLIESIYSCMSFLAILPCSVLADRIGRKPVILGGTLGLAVSVVCFGMSKSFLAMVISRCLGGALGGVWACTRIVVGELTDKSNQGLAFSAHVVAYRMGQIIGFPMGGLLAHPERKFPLFRTPFWNEYPFALPCFVASTLCVCTVTMGYFLLEETLGSRQEKPAEEAAYGSIGLPADIDPSLPSPTFDAESHLPQISFKQKYKSIMTPSIISLLCSNAALCLVSEIPSAVFPLFSFTPISSGGLGMSEAGIGTQMGIRAVLCIVIMGFYSTLQRRLGAVRVYQLTMWTWPVIMACFPLLNFLARRGGTNGWLFIVTFTIFLIVWGIGGLAWTAIAVMVNDSAPSAHALATINGLSQMCIILPQALAPAGVTSLFAASIKSHIASGNLIWIILFILAFIAAGHSMILHEPDTDWRKR